MSIRTGPHKLPHPESSGIFHKFYSVSLGQGQIPIATRMTKQGMREVSSFCESCCQNLNLVIKSWYLRLTVIRLRYHIKR